MLITESQRYMYAECKLKLLIEKKNEIENSHCMFSTTEGDTEKMHHVMTKISILIWFPTWDLTDDFPESSALYCFQ